MRFQSFGLPRDTSIFAPPSEDYPTQETPPIFLPELPDDLPEKSVEEERDEREAGQEMPPIIKTRNVPDAAPPIVPERGSPVLPVAAIIGAALLLL